MKNFKELLEARNNKQSKKDGIQYLSLEKGKSMNVRFIPIFWEEAEMECPFKVGDIHYYNKSYSDCKGKDCELCKMASESWKMFKQTEDPKYKDLFKATVKSTRYTMLCFDLDDPDSPVYQFSTQSKTIKEQLDILINKGRDFSDKETGRNATIRRADNDFGSYTIIFDDPSEVADSIWEHFIELRDKA